nr:hypothetical protein [Tanacetum cinerariifolium]
MNEQITRDAEIARIHAEEELHIMIDGLDRSNETVAKNLHEYHQFAIEWPIERIIDLISDLVRYQDNYAKEEAERFKRKGIRRFDQESVKKLKTSEEVKATKEVPEEKVKEMMQLVPVEEVYVEALQVKHPIIDWKVHTEGQRSYWKITRLGDSSASYQFFVDMLKHLDREDLNQLWRLVELKRIYEPDDTDQMWTHTQNFMHAPVEWKLYKLQLDNYSQMANDLILKIYKIANCLSQQGIPTASYGVPTASEESSHCQKKRDPTAMKIALLLKSSSNCQSKSYDSYA